MDMYTNSSAWIQQQHQQIPESQNVQLETRPSSAHDWKDPATSASSAPAGPSAGSNAHPTLDLSDFGLGDITGPSSSTPSMSPPAQSHFNSPFSQYSFYMSSGGPGPYNAVPYGSAWAGPNGHQVPLSNYSTLDGATNPGSSSQQQSQPQSNSSQQMMIDPALTTMNSSSSNGIQRYPQSPNLLSAHSSSQQSPLTQYQFQQHLHPSALSINPAYVQSSQIFHQQQQSQQQGTLSPHALHATSPVMGSLAPPSFYSQVQAPAFSALAMTPQMKKEWLQAAIRPLLQPAAFTGAGAVQSLVGYIDDFGSQDVDAQLRSEILTKIRDNAGNHYFRAWSENPTAMDITREWLKAGYTGKADNQMMDTIMPILHIIDRLPLTLDSLKTSKLGKLIIKLTKDPPAPAVKDMASNLERKWRQMMNAAADGTSKNSEGNESEDTKPKKRKPSDPPSSKAAPPAKKVAVSSASTSAKPTTVKKETRAAVVPSVVKSDSSFFSAPKRKPKLPSFKKAPVSVKKELDPNVAQPSAIDPFQEALKDMAKARKMSPAAAPTPPPAPSSSTPPLSVGLTKPGKKKKMVTWAADGQLESVRLIERAIYDDEPTDGMHPTHNLRDLDRGEGAALHAHLFEEAIDWFDPPLVEIPDSIENRPRGEESQEKSAQEEREQTALGALYMSPAQIPDSPAEPSIQIADDKVDADVKIMLTGPEVDSMFWSGGPLPSSSQHMPSVAELVGQLTAGTDVPMDSLPSMDGQHLDLKAFGLEPSLLSSMQSLPTEQLQQIMQQAQMLAMTQSSIFGQSQPAQQSTTTYSGGDQDWNHKHYSDYDQGYQDDSGGRERRYSSDQGWESRGSSRGRGRGRGRGDFRHSKRKPCSFFAQGRCKYGDQCDYSHEAIY